VKLSALMWAWEQPVETSMQRLVLITLTDAASMDGGVALDEKYAERSACSYSDFLVTVGALMNMGLLQPDGAGRCRVMVPEEERYE
jgi:hypothetical protein